MQLQKDLAADGRAASRLRVLASTASLSLPSGDLDVFCGLADSSFPWTAARDWAALVGSRHFDSHFFEGGHDFLKTCEAQIFSRVRSCLCDRLASLELPNATTGSAAVVAEPEPLLHSVQWEMLQAGPAAQLGGAELCVVPVGVLEVTLTDAMVAAAAGPAGLILSLLGDSSGSTAAGGYAGGSSWLEAEEAQCWALVQLLQALAARGVAGRLVVVTKAAACGAMAVGASKSQGSSFPSDE